ncbi:MAG: carboxypeptidase regulatory-like domain-containing protein [bacterium]
MKSNFILQPFCLLILLFLVSAFPARGEVQPGFDPSVPPGLPSQIPPPIQGISRPSPVHGSAPVPAGTQKIEVSYTLPPGWSVISFPLARLDSASGFTRLLYRYSNGMYYPVDPVNAPESIDPRLGYLVFSDKEAAVKVTGIRNTYLVRYITLNPGWNLIGCPALKKLSWSNAVASRAGVTRVISDAVGITLEGQTGSWLSAFAYAFDGNAYVQNILDPGASLEPQRGLWVFAFQPLILSGNNVAPENRPQITSVVPPSVFAGQVFAIVGSGFGKYKGQVNLEGIPIQEEDIASWGDKCIQVRLPPYVKSGDLIVMAGNFPSNSVKMSVTTDVTRSSVGTVLGKVVSSSKSPLAGAQVFVDSGQSSISAADGSYTITNIPPGSHTVYVSLPGYNEAQGQVLLEPGGSKSVLISLSSLSAIDGTSFEGFPPPGIGRPAAESAKPPKADKPRTGILHVVAHPYDDEYHRWWINHIEVFEIGNYDRRWENSWDKDLNDAWYELDCDGAEVGKTYRIKIRWKMDKTGESKDTTWDRRMESTHQTVTFDSPFSALPPINQWTAVK